MNLEYAKNHLLLYAGLVKNNMLNKGNHFYLDLVNEMIDTLPTPATSVSISQLEMFYEFLVVFDYSVTQGESDINANMRIGNYIDIQNALQTDQSWIIINQVMIELADLCMKNIKILCSLSIGHINRMLEMQTTDEIQAKLLARKEILEKILEALPEDMSPEQMDELALMLMVTELDMDLLNRGISEDFFSINGELFEYVATISHPQAVVEDSAGEEGASLCEWLFSLVFGERIYPTDQDEHPALEVVGNHNLFPAAAIGHVPRDIWQLSDI